MAQYYQTKLSGIAGPSDSALPTASTVADLLASVIRPASVLGKAASDSLPGSITAPSTPGTAFPFSAAVAGKHVKVDLPKPNKFSRIAVDSDIRAWLLRMHECLTISGIEPSVWVVFASNYLDKAPLRLWEACKTQLSNQPEVLYSWDNFREWCLSSLSVHDHETHAISQLEKLHQTGSVAKCKAAHDVLAAQTALPMKLRLFWWERGLKDEIRVMCSLDPLTHKQYADIEAAQNAACACDAHLKSASVPAASRKRGAQPSTASAWVNQRPQQCARFADHPSRPVMDTRIAKWRGDAPADFTCDTGPAWGNGPTDGWTSCSPYSSPYSSTGQEPICPPLTDHLAAKACHCQTGRILRSSF